MFSPQTLIGFPSSLIGEGKIYRSPMPTERELAAIKSELKVTTIVQLCFDNEFEKCGKKSTLAHYQKMEFDVIKFPIEDFKVPESFEETERVVEEILQRTNRGENVLIHCVAGRGRTGLLIACIAKRVLQLQTGRQAIDWVRKFIPGAVERQVQEQFIEKFLSRQTKEEEPIALPKPAISESSHVKDAPLSGLPKSDPLHLAYDPSALEMGLLREREQTEDSPSRRPLLSREREQQADCLDCFCHIL